MRSARTTRPFVSGSFPFSQINSDADGSDSDFSSRGLTLRAGIGVSAFVL